MTIKERLVVLDFDDTLYFTFDSVKEAARELYGTGMTVRHIFDEMPVTARVKAYYLGHSKYRNRSKLNKKLVKRIAAYGNRTDIVIVTGRDRELQAHTLALAGQSGLKIKEIYFAADIAKDSKEWKLRTLKKLAKNYKSVELYEDKGKNIDYISSNVPDDGKFKFYLVKGGRFTRVREPQPRSPSQ